MALSGVSRGTRISFRLSFNVTSAARSISDRDAPTAIADNVPIEQGHTIIPAVSAEPEAGGAPRSSFENVSTHEFHPSLPTASLRASIDPIPDSVSSSRIPYFDTISDTGRCAATSCCSSLTAYGAPDAPVTPITIGGVAVIVAVAQ